MKNNKKRSANLLTWGFFAGTALSLCGSMPASYAEEHPVLLAQAELPTDEELQSIEDSISAIEDEADIEIEQQIQAEKKRDMELQKRRLKEAQKNKKIPASSEPTPRNKKNLQANASKLTQNASNGSANIEADTLDYNTKEGKVAAKGNVVITYGQRTLKTESVQYDQKNKVITARDNIHLQDGYGNNYYASDAVINDTMTQGHINNVSGTLNDNSKFSAVSGTRHSEDLMRLDRAAYTPCKVCKKNFNGKPFWGLKANSVKIDNETERMSYQHARMELFGLPILYTPYFSHPTPDAKRKSGFLFPSYSSISTLGFALTTPYYYSIAPEMDLTLEPTLTSEEGMILAGKFRHLTSVGQYDIKGSITNPKKRNILGDRIEGRDIRGHIEGHGRFILDDNWTAGFNAKRASDDTYLHRYKFGNEDVLTSRGYVEKISGRDYIGIETLSFQGLNATDDPEKTPLALPWITAHLESAPGFMGSRWIFDGDSLVLSRDTGVESRRISGTGTWHLPWVTKGGHVFEFNASLRGDIYNVDNVTTGQGTKDGYIGRAIPEARLSWNYPLVKQTEHAQFYLEPMADLIVSPAGGNPDKIPNEDSQVFELSDVNLFSSNHFSGLDRVEGGPRTNYGFRSGIKSDSSDIDLLFGQSYRATTDTSFTPQSGMYDNFSDYVGRIRFSTQKNDAYLSYRFRMDKDDLTLRRNEVSAFLNMSPFSINAGYVQTDEEDSTLDRHEIYGASSWKINNNWSLFGSGRRDISDGGGWVNTAAGFIYENECIRFRTEWNREFTRDRDIEPNTSYMLKISFRNFGEL